MFSDVYAAHYGVGCGGVRDSFLSTNPLSMDVEHPIRIENFSAHDIDIESRIFIGIPNEL